MDTHDMKSDYLLLFRMLQHEIEKVTPEEMQKRWDSMVGGECAGPETV